MSVNIKQNQINRFAVDLDSKTRKRVFKFFFFVIQYIYIYTMFQNINDDVDFYCYLYKNTILQSALTEYLNKKNHI